MQIDNDTLRAALEGAVKPLEWKNGTAVCNVLGGEYSAWRVKSKRRIEETRRARILSAIDLDTLAAKLGGDNV